MRSNCLVFAHARFWRAAFAWWKSGRPASRKPRIHVMPSEHAPWWIPHHEIRYFDGTQMIVESFEPIDKSILPWWKLPGVIIFKGEVVRRIAEPGD